MLPTGTGFWNVDGSRDTKVGRAWANAAAVVKASSARVVGTKLVYVSHTLRAYILTESLLEEEAAEDHEVVTIAELGLHYRGCLETCGVHVNDVVGLAKIIVWVWSC